MNWLFVLGFPFFEFSGNFHHIRLHYPRELQVLVRVIDGGLDHAVQIERRAAVGTAVATSDFFHVVILDVDFAPSGLVRH